MAVIALLYGGGTLAVLWLLRAHRAGRTKLLVRGGSLAGEVFRLPGWAALPILVAVVSLVALMLGGYWDIGYHIDVGRDEGPLGNAGHYPMLFGFFGTFAAGVLCVGMARDEDPSPAWVRVPGVGMSPVGGVLLVFCATFGLVALPIDDVWHRIFGQDVTLWSPTHFMLLLGGSFSVIAMAVLVAEGARARRRAGAAIGSGADNPLRPLIEQAAPRAGRLRGRLDSLAPLSDRVWPALEFLWTRGQRVALLGGMLVGLEAFLAEYDWGVPLYRAVWQPLLLAAFSGFVFAAARLWAGRGGALGAWGIYFVVRLVATAMPVLADRSPAALPLLLVPAICVELAAFGFEPRSRPLAFGAAAGVLCGTIGFAGEYAWSQLVMPLPWTEALIAEGLPSAVVAGTAGGLLGALLGSALGGHLPPVRATRAACLGSFAVLIALGVNAGIREIPDARAHVEVTSVGSGEQREGMVTVHLEPADAAEDANWFYILAWQGGGQRVIDHLEQEAPGVYRSTEPIPLGGSWKSGLRLHSGRARGAVPLRLPADAALPGADRVLPASFTSEQAGTAALKGTAGAELPAAASFTRPFLEDGLIVLREQKHDVPGWMWTAAIALIAAFYVLYIAGIALGVARFARRDPRPAAGWERVPVAPSSRIRGAIGSLRRA